MYQRWHERRLGISCDTNSDTARHWEDWTSGWNNMSADQTDKRPTRWQLPHSRMAFYVSLYCFICSQQKFTQGKPLGDIDCFILGELLCDTDCLNLLLYFYSIWYIFTVFGISFHYLVYFMNNWYIFIPVFGILCKASQISFSDW
jgi:hypothetical protein